MKKLVVAMGSDYVNMPADRIFPDEHFLYCYRGEDLVGMFMIGTFDRAYINEVKTMDEITGREQK